MSATIDRAAAWSGYAADRIADPGLGQEGYAELASIMSAYHLFRMTRPTVH